MDLEGAFAVYKRCKENEIPLSHGLYTNLLSLTAGLGDPSCCCGPTGDSAMALMSAFPLSYFAEAYSTHKAATHQPILASE